MKSTNKIAAGILTAMFLTTGTIYAQDKEKGVDVTFGSDVVSSYIWRGSYNAGASIQPSIALKAGGFALTAWGSVDFKASDYKEVDLTASYSFKGLTFSVTDYYWTGSPLASTLPRRNYFNFGADSPHMIEVGAAYCFGEDFPLSVAWYTMLFGADKDQTTGRQNYSTYAEISYPFSVKSVDMSAWAGFTPWETRNMYGTTGFAVCNVGIGAAKAIRFSDKFSLPLFTRIIWNPAKEDVNIVGGFSIYL